MAKTAFQGPLIVYGQRLPPGNAGPTNPDLAPSLFWGGDGLFDPRGGYNLTRRGALGFLGTQGITVIDQAVATKGTAKVAALQHTTAATKLTLAVASTGITVLASALTVWPSGNAVPAGSLVLDGNPALVAFGTADLSSGYTMVSLYDPTKAASRCLSFTTSADMSAVALTVAGYDIYGYPLTQTVTLPGSATTVNSTKAFKFVTSITASATDGTNNVSVGTADIIGLPIRADTFGDVLFDVEATKITASTGFVAAVTTSPATATTGDVRGTYALQTAADGTRVFRAIMFPKVGNIGTITGLFGVSQV